MYVAARLQKIIADHRLAVESIYPNKHKKILKIKKNL
jgi:hypothetical protein